MTSEATAIRRATTVSFDELYAAHYADLTVQLYAYFGDRQEAQDVVQEAFCRALARWPAVAGYDDPVAWVRRVAWNLAVSKWRRTRTACVGPGSVGLVVTGNTPGSGRSDGKLVDEKISCTEAENPEAYPSHNLVHYEAGRRLWVTVTPDAAARNAAGFAYALQPAG